MMDTSYLRKIIDLEKKVNKEALSETPFFHYSCIAYRNSDFTHDSSGNWLYPDLNTNAYDPKGMHSTVTNPSRITVPVAGLYMISWGAQFVYNATGSRGILIQKNRSTTMAVQAGDANNGQMHIATIARLAANDYIEGGIIQSSGGNLVINWVTEYSLYLKVTLLP